MFITFLRVLGHIIWGTIFGMLVALMFATIAKADVTCQYDFGLKEIRLSNPTKLKKLNRQFTINGLQYKVNVENVAKSSETDDWVQVTDGKHTMTYSMECKND